MRSVLLLSFLCLSLLSFVTGQLGLQQPIPRSVNEQRFRPTTNSQSAVDYCGGQQMADAKSSVFTESPATSINTIFNNVPAGDNPRIVISMVQYFRNGTQANGNPRYYNLVTVLSNETAVLRAGTNQRYYKPMSIPERFAGCGTDDSTRCVLRWVYDNSMSTNQDSRISCADVVVRSRSDDVRVTVTIGLTGGERPIQSNTALNRLLGSTWATATDRLIDIYTSPDDATLSLSNQIRLGAEPITNNDDGSYTITYIFSGTPTKSASDLAGSFVSENLSNLFDLNVIAVGINGASIQHASIGLTILLAMLAWTMQRA